jgi:ComF family protein
MEAEFYCVSCRTPFQNRFPLDADGRCGLCRNGLRGFDAAYCYGAYEGVLRDLVHLFKYSGVRTLAGTLGKLLNDALPGDEMFDLIVPVPLHWRKRWQRGFNQSELLGIEISRRTGVPLANVLRRARATSVQAGLSNTARRRNVRAAFQCRSEADGSRVRGKRVLLIDDVMTTGSTAAACAVALRRAGAAHITLLTAARVDRRFEAPVDAHSSVRGETN